MRKIALDPGHFGGTLSEIEDRHFKFENHLPVKEGDLNIKVALKLAKLLEKETFKVLISRESFEKFKLPKDFSKDKFEMFKKENWEKRSEKINNFKPDLALAIHFNANSDSSKGKECELDGVMTFIHNEDPTLISYAKILAKNLSLDFGLGFCRGDWFPSEIASKWKDIGAGVNVRDLFILRKIKSPIVLTEGPMMNNKETYLSLIKSDELLQTYANSLFKSIKEIFSSDLA